MFENPRRGRQARNFATNVPKILELKSSSEQIFSENCRWVPLLRLVVQNNRDCLSQQPGCNEYSTSPGRILSDSVGIETANTLIHSVGSLSETIPDSRPKWAKSIPFSDRINGAKTIPFGASHLCMAYIMREYSPPGFNATEK